MKNRFVTLLAVALAASSLAGIAVAQKKGGGSGPKKVELPHPFYWAAAAPLRGDWQGTGGLVAQAVPVMDKIYSKEHLIPQQEDNGKYEVHLFKQFDQPNDTPVAILTGSLAGDTLALEGGGWAGTIQGGTLLAKKKSNGT